MSDTTTAAPPQLVHLTVDGQPLSAPPGTLLIEACKQAHIEVPSFCYYPNLSLQAACRMCLVEIEKMPKLQTACTVVVAEGMVVKTDTPAVHGARKSAIEFILTNHPLDCPVCDAGGECELQDMTFRYGAEKSRFVEPKQHRDEQQWSPVVFFDRPRCILCYRCVRACGEGMDVWALGVGNRGVHATIIPNREDHLECEECGQCIDICPVGALTSGAYRYKTRPWEMKHTGAICTFCGDGCKTTLGVRNGEIVRGDNRDRSGINNDFLCVKGRYAFDFTRHPDRLKQPLVRRDGELRPTSWTNALQTVGRKLRELRNAGAPMGVIAGTRILNEEAYTLQRFARTLLGTNNLDHGRSADIPTLLDALAGAAASAPLAAANDLRTAPAILLVGGDPTQQHPLLASNIRFAYRQHKTRLYLINHRDVRLKRQAFRMARIDAAAYGQALGFLLGEGPDPAASLSAVGEPEDKRWPQLPVPHPRPVAGGLEDFRARLGQERDLIVVFGAEVQREDIRKLVAFGKSLGGRVRYVCLAENSNSRGVADLGLYPDLLPGYESLHGPARARFEALWGGAIPAEPGLNRDQMLAAPLAALLVVGANPLRGRTPPAGAFLVVQDLFLTETAQAADVVLPALAAYEKSGTVTNTCGEVQATRAAAAFEGAKSDLEILHLLASAMGADWGPPDADQVFQQIRAHVKGYAVSLVQLVSGNSAASLPLNGRVTHASLPIHPSQDSLFTAGTLGRFSPALNAVLERRLPPEDAS